MEGYLGISTFVFDEENRGVALPASRCCTHTLTVSATPLAQTLLAALSSTHA